MRKKRKSLATIVRASVQSAIAGTSLIASGYLGWNGTAPLRDAPDTRPSETIGAVVDFIMQLIVRREDGLEFWAIQVLFALLTYVLLTSLPIFIGFILIERLEQGTGVRDAGGTDGQ